MRGGQASVLLGFLFVCSTTDVQATVYGWAEGGVLHFSNELEAVPEAQRAAAQKFTSKLPSSAPPAVTEQAPPPERETAAANLQMEEMRAYERGLERGLQTAERQVELAGKLAQTVLAAAPRPPPTRIIIQQPGPTIIREVSPAFSAPFYSFIGPYAPPFWGSPYGHGYTYAYGFRRLVPHSHFFPGSRRSLRTRRGSLFFPHGHFSHHGFLFGHGFVVR